VSLPDKKSRPDLDDPDSPEAGHPLDRVQYPAGLPRITRAQPNAKVLANGAQQGETSAGSRVIIPLPSGRTSHRYVFRLYAVDMDITQPTADRDSIDWALTGHTLAKTEFTTTFKR